MIVVISLIAGFFIAWGSNVATQAMDNDKSWRDRVLFLVAAVVLSALAILMVMLYVT